MIISMRLKVPASCRKRTILPVFIARLFRAQMKEKRKEGWRPQQVAFVLIIICQKDKVTPIPNASIMSWELKKWSEKTRQAITARSISHLFDTFAWFPHINTATTQFSLISISIASLFIGFCGYAKRARRLSDANHEILSLRVNLYTRRK